MGYVVVHLEKAQGNDAEMSSHIERKISPANAVETRSYLNKELAEFPEGVENRSQAIQHRIENAGIKRKIGKNQVRAIRIMLSGTHEDMKEIEQSGKLPGWCDDNMQWLRDTFGKENVVSAVLYMDEKTPHIHATIVPIVTGERRKAKKQKECNTTKKKYKKKSKNTVRLCADDVMTREKLKEYQDSYAEKMKPYGLERGIKGSDARHISTQQFYRDLFVENQNLKQEIVHLEEQKQEVYEDMRNQYDMRDKARDKFISMDNYVKEKQKLIEFAEKQLQEIKERYKPYKAQQDMDLLCEILPGLNESLRVAKILRQIGLPVKSIKEMFQGKIIPANGGLYSAEHNRRFQVERAQIRIQKDEQMDGRFKVTINGINHKDWFDQKQRESVRQTVIPPKKQSRGMKM